MNGAIFYAGQYGSTAQYAGWISDATGLPAFDIKDRKADPSAYDFLVLGSSVIVYKLTIRKWVQSNLSAIENKPLILFTVSGAPAGAKLDSWIAGSLPQNILATAQHVALRGRMNPAELGWWTRLILKIGAWQNKDSQARREELEGFDFIDKSSIEPIVTKVRQLKRQSAEPVHTVH